MNSANAQTIPNDVKTYFLDKSSYAACRLMKEQISTKESREYMLRTLKSAIRNYDLNQGQVNSLNLWTEEQSTMKSLGKLTRARMKNGRGSTKCSMEGDNNWLPYVQKAAKES
jgi:neutral trehalase